MRSKKIVCHPNNLKKIAEIADKVDECPDLFQIWGYEIITDSSIPEVREVKTGKIIWHNNDFIDYREPANLDTSWKEYLEMCLYFNWCHEEVKEEIVFYEMDSGSFDFAIGALGALGQYEPTKSMFNMKWS